MLSPQLVGVEHLRSAMSGPTVVLGNHLAYFDASALDCALAWDGHADLADRLVAAAGPKVYEATFRRIAAACLHTLPVPQTNRLAHTKQLSARELARQALASIRAAKEASQEGRALVLYPEGARTRTGQMVSFVRGVHRYLGVADQVSVAPCAILGTEKIRPVGARKLRPGRLEVRFGEALTVGTDGDTKSVLEQTFHSIGRLLPPSYRPSTDTPPLA